MTPEPAKQTTALRPVAIVSLDGGGVRGLSSLLILQRLLGLVTEELVEAGVHSPDNATVRPQDVFDVATGTSTGGLIVLMMVKLDMSLDECIQQYKKLSRRVFSKRRSLVKRIFGSDWSKYSGNRLQKAVEDLLESRNHPVTLMMRSASQNSMRGTVLCHEVQQPHSIFFCTEECQGPYQQYMLQYDLEMRHAARATSAAPSYFQEMTIEERYFVDGGYGQTNNPSWESKVHYHRNHDVTRGRQLVMINVGTGSIPTYANVDRLQTRPWWTRFVPAGLLKALGLVADLVQMATDSEQPAERLRYISEETPTQLFFKRFSADTGIHKIQLDDWKAVEDTDGVGVIEERTKAYLNDPLVLSDLKQAAQKLAEVYCRRREDVKAVTSEAALNDQESINLSISVVVAGKPGESSTAGQAHFAPGAEAVPSLVTGTELTQSPDPSPPQTPEPDGKLPLPTTATESQEILQGQGQQFKDNVVPTMAHLNPGSAERSRSPRARRALTMPVSLLRVEEERLSSLEWAKPAATNTCNETPTSSSRDSSRRLR
ncbi:hypothetical protein H2200_004609 [Cladophialophora chaetospira]|uniref:PNPLA domain-containing protein n=1 Tax=Cladophialophora chaetospira TaxID=386627 RepID=A0AA38XDM0_9EURO|nr:hypothetical protein H2200_004609 [Cladophialophora chaetospira]